MNQLILCSPLTVSGREISNRVVFQPMEGCDCHEDGSPDLLTEEKYLRAAESGAGVIWFEANAVCPEGRTNRRQMMLTEENLSSFKALTEKVRARARESSGTNPVLILQLTHSGRQSISPLIMYRHPIYEERRPVSPEAVLKDEYLDTLPALYGKSASLAIRAGFDGVDVKSCHGYLLQEALSAFTREGRYGGSFENRTRLYMDIIDEVKKNLPASALLTARLGVSDMIKKPYGFGTNEKGELDLEESDRLIGMLRDKGISILNVTVGNPYFNPHVNRPYRKGGYEAPEAAEVGLRRFVSIEKHIKEKFPTLTVVASGVSYYRDELIECSEELLASGACDLVGYGRAWLAYPSFYKDFLEGKFDSRKCCLACSKCTELMRAGKVSGCAVFNSYYRELYKEIKK